MSLIIEAAAAPPPAALQPVLEQGWYPAEWTMQLSGLKWGPWSVPAITLDIRCPAGGAAQILPACDQGTWTWRPSGPPVLRGWYRWLPGQSLQIGTGPRPTLPPQNPAAPPAGATGTVTDSPAGDPGAVSDSRTVMNSDSRTVMNGDFGSEDTGTVMKDSGTIMKKDSGTIMNGDSGNVVTCPAEPSLPAGAGEDAAGFVLRVDFDQALPAAFSWCFEARGNSFGGVSAGWPVAWGEPPALAGQWHLAARGNERSAAVRLAIGDGQIESAAGLVAGEGLKIDAEAAVQRVAAGWTAALRFDLGPGEILLGDIYLAPDETPLRLSLIGRYDDGGAWAVERLVFSDPAGLEATGEAHGDRAGPNEFGLRLAPLDLAPLQAGYFAGWLARQGWQGLSLGGRIAGRLQWRRGLGVDADLELSGAGIDDPSGRLHLDGLDATLAWRAGGGRPALNLARWNTLTIGALTFGGAELHGVAAAHSFALTAPLRLPLYDGALHLDRLAVSAPPGAPPAIGLEARLESLDLTALSAAFGWLPFTGRVSGTLPGARYREGVLHLDGEVRVELFGGSVTLHGVSIERPFGVLPALAGEIDIAAIDLEQLTSALPIGFMTGTLEGHLRHLRLLDWQPVAFDGWLGSAPGRGGRISQRAVDSISRLGGGVGIDSLVLRLFETFPYRRFGLGCRLQQGVCLMQGTGAPAGESGPGANDSFVIVEGRGLPRLTVVGHERRVDWPRLLANLKRLVSGELQAGTAQ